MSLKKEEVTLTLTDGSVQVFKIKELSWYEESLLSDSWTFLKFQELCIEEPVMNKELWQKISREEGKKLLEAVRRVNKKDDDPKKV